MPFCTPEYWVDLRCRERDSRSSVPASAILYGENPKAVQERLGHDSISETLDRYLRVSADKQQRAAARFDAIFDESSGDQSPGTE
jgi:integrase